jgi:hypothetical protein
VGGLLQLLLRLLQLLWLCDQKAQRCFVSRGVFYQRPKSQTQPSKTPTKTHTKRTPITITMTKGRGRVLLVHVFQRDRRHHRGAARRRL